MWIAWAGLAIEHERQSLAERQTMLHEYAQSENFAATLGRETDEAILSICSASFAMDSLIGVSGHDW
jgi:hypothetical protein